MTEKHKKIFERLKHLFLKNEKEDEGQGKKATTIQYAVIILAAGIAFMLLGNFFSNDTESNETISVMSREDEDEEAPTFGQQETEPSSMADYENTYENQLKEVLEKIVGVDSVTVMVNLDSTESKVLEKNIVVQSQLTDETDREGGKRQVEDESRDEQVVILRSGDQEQPIIVKTEKPTVRGVLVVAEGVDNIEVKKMVTDAVTKVMDVPVHRVSVLPKKIEEE